MEIKKLEYQHGKHILTRLYYENLPEHLLPKEGDIVQEANSREEDEFKILDIREDVATVQELSTKIKRTFYINGLRKSAKQIKRDKKAKALVKRQELWKRKEEKEKKRAEKLLRKLEREEAKKNRKLKFKRVREVTIKFV